MKISGLQKLTLLDYPGKMACTVFIHGCNFRCPFCHNALLVTAQEEPILSEEEFFSFLNKRQGILDGVCITGGEPTIQKDLPDFIRKIKDMGYLVKLDTNGYNPQVLEKIFEEKAVDYVAMDIKNSELKYALTAGISNMDMQKIKKSISLIEQSGVDHEFRTTVVKELHTKEDLMGAAELIGKSSKYFLQQFKDSGNLICDNLNGYDDGELRQLCDEVKEKGYNVSLRGI